MASEIENCKIWIRFESKKKDGSIIKLRIQDLPKTRMDDFIIFLTTYFVKDEAFHKAAGVYKTREAISEYKEALTRMYELNPPKIAICCLDENPEDFDEILAVSTVQLMSHKLTWDDILLEMNMELKTKEMQDMINIMKVVVPKFPESLKEIYPNFHEGRGIIVHPEYRNLGIATQIVKQRRLLCQECDVSMTCAWMTSIGSQKAAERDGWKTVAEVTLEELDQLTGLNFYKDIPTYKLMIATTKS